MILATQALQLIEQAISLHDNYNLYATGHFERWKIQEIRKEKLMLCAQILRSDYLPKQRKSPVLPNFERQVFKRSHRSACDG